MFPPAMSGKNPFKIIVQKFPGTFDLLGPGVPADTVRSGDAVFIYEEMISREKKFFLIEHHHMTFGMARDFDDLKFRSYVPVSVSLKNVFTVFGGRGELILVNDSLTMEVIMKELMVGHIIPMGENHHRHS